MAKYPTFPTLFDEVKRVAISDLRRWKYLRGFKSGVFTWNRNGEVTGSINISVEASAEHISPYIEFNYLIDKEPINYRVALVRVPSNLGKGSIWYFLCPQTKKRCRILYLIGKYFLHREAFIGAMYARQTYSKSWRNFKKLLDDLDLADTLDEKHFRTHYNGIPTKRFKSLLRRYVRNSRITEDDARRLME